MTSRARSSLQAGRHPQRPRRRAERLRKLRAVGRAGRQSSARERDFGGFVFLNTARIPTLPRRGRSRQRCPGVILGLALAATLGTSLHLGGLAGASRLAMGSPARPTRCRLPSCASCRRRRSSRRSGRALSGLLPELPPRPVLFGLCSAAACRSSIGAAEAVSASPAVANIVAVASGVIPVSVALITLFIFGTVGAWR